MPGISAFGTTFAIGSAALSGSPSYTNVAQVNNISGPGFSVDTADVTSHDSPGAWEEVVPVIKRSGEITLDLNYDPSVTTHGNTSGLLNLMANKTLRAFRIVFPSASPVTWTFDGYVTGFEPGAPHDDKLTASVTIKLTGAPNLA